MKFYFKEFLIVFIVVAVMVFVLGWSWIKQPTTIQIGDSKIPVEIVRTPEALTKGLSNRTLLAADSGMLFVMPKRGIYGFWMKDMLFPIDIIWIADNKVVAVDNNIQPLARTTGVIQSGEESNDTNLKTYSPPETVDHVLEVNAGFAVKHHFENGTAVILP